MELGDLPAAWHHVAIAVTTTALVLASGAVFGESRARRAASLALGLVALVPPWLAPAEPGIARALYAMASLLPIVKWLDHARDPIPRSLAFRLWSFSTPFDVRHVERVARSFDVRLATSVVLHGLAGVVGLVVHGSARDIGVVPARAIELLGGVAILYGMVGSVADLIRLGYRAAGLAVPPIQRAPAAARTAQEFWSARWNRPIHEWLSRHFFRPVARRAGARWGLAATFAGSALLHFWIAAVPLGLEMAAWMAAFFVVQGGVVWLERSIGVRRWRPARAHAWTIVVMLATSPLFVEPFLRMLPS